MRIIALDLGSTMAFAANPDGYRDTRWGHLFCDPDKMKRPHRAAATAIWLQTLLRGAPVDVVIYETPFARGQHATRSLWGLAGLIEAAAWNGGAAVLDRPPSTIKQWACGSGKASKDDMLAAARRMGYTGDNEHEADAFCLLKYAEAKVEV